MYDHIIVGQGIAGSVLALTLLQQGKKIIVIDDDRASHSSVVAAGLINPIVPKRLTLSWKAEVLIPFADAFYRDAEKLLHSSFYYDRDLLKPFANEEEKEFWLKQAKGEMKEYLSDEVIDFMPGRIHNPSGTASVKSVTNLDTVPFLDEVKSYLLSRNAFLQEQFDIAQLEVNTEVIRYKTLAASRIIFCEGYRGKENPYFGWLPFALTKGELLTVRIQDLETTKVVNKGVFILPLGGDLYKVGATYRWNDMNEIATEDARAELVQKLEKVLKIPYEIIGQQAGVRPTVKDRRPLIGVHPEHSRIAIFNGMGSKGAMIAPFFAKQLADHLDNNLPLDPEADIKRFL